MHLLTATITLVASGCRQTTPTAGSGALMPLTPNSGSAAPTFQPFVGQTRVTPPPTGSYSVPNNYLGGVPTSQMGNPAAAVGGNAATQNPPIYAPSAAGQQVIGSGVLQTGWTETGTNVAQPTAPNSGTFAPGGYPSAAAPARDPRSGGMQVIDMTGAPAPPGYRANVVPQAGFNTPTISHRDFNQPPSFAPIRSIQAPQQSDFAGANSPPAGVIAGVPQFEPRQLANTQAAPQQNPTGQYPTQQYPTQQYPASAGGNLTPVGSAPPLNPVTPQGSAPTDSLPWRSPGAQY